MMAKEPENKDMLLAFSSCPGYVSVRNRENGSWFIQDLCEVQIKSQNLILSKTSKVFMENSHSTNVRDMMDMVSEKISQRESTQGLKQQCKIEVDCFIPVFNCLYLLE